MAEPAPPMSVPVQSRKQHRAAKRKEKRKRKRQAVAQASECGLKGGSSTPEEGLGDGDEENDLAEEERLRLHDEWLERERIAQEEFRLKFEKEEAARKRKEDEERLIKEEWEAQQRREQEEKEQKQQEKRDKEEPSYSLSNRYRTCSHHSKDEAVQKMLDEAETQLEEGRPWMNPEAPVKEKTENFGTERDVANCPFFLKTGACRFGDRCSRKHVYPTASPTLMIRGMFTTFGLEESCRDDYDIDAYLEHSEEDLHESFLEFYQDVLPEFRSVGKVIQFKVSCNHEPHLRGNVYVQFDTEEQCKDAFIRFNGRWYAGRQLHCEICPVTRWKNAICGLFDRRTCPKGKHCNFLHVFRNPDNEFRDADRDLHLSPDRSVRGSRRDGAFSERYGDRSWRQRHSSRSPPGSERSHSRREDDRRRSRSRERRGSLWEREERWSSRSRHSDRRKDRNLGRDRVRSRSRDREQRHRSRDKDRESKCSDDRDRDEVDRRESRKRSRSTSTERENRQEKSKELSPKIPEKSSKHSRHKRSKKNKKKSKKKHKKKNHLSEASASSGESDKESEEETKNCPPSGQTNETELIAKNGDVDVNVDTDSVPSEQPITEILTSQPETATEMHI